MCGTNKLGWWWWSDDNATYDDYFDYERVDKSTVYALRDVIFYVVLTLGIPGNILSAIIWLRRHVVSKNSSAVYLATLAVNDLLYLLTDIIWNMRVTIPTWLSYCRRYLSWTTTNLEPLLVVGFSVERLIAISCPLKVRFKSIVTKCYWQKAVTVLSNGV